MIREITAVIVSWNDEEDVRECVRALAAARARLPEGGVRVSLVVVDNGGGLSAPAIEALWPGARVLVNASNRGFAPAANQGAAVADGDAVLFLNPDTRAEGEPFSPIARAFDAERVVAVAPRLTEMDGAAAQPGALALSPPGNETQATFQLRRLPTLASDARELLLLDHAAPNNPGRRRARYAGEDRDRPFAVEQAAAAALAVRKSALERIGGFDERFIPAWYEDVDLCDRLGRDGGVLVYTPEARFRHRGGESAGRLGYDRFLPILYRNALRYRQPRYGGLARLTYRGLLATGMALRLTLLPLRRKVPRPRAEAARAYRRVLWLALGRESDEARSPADPS